MIVLPVSVAEYVGIKLGLRGFNRDLVARAIGEFGQERVSRRAVVDDRGISETQVHGRRPDNAVERSIQRCHAVFSGRLRPRLQVRLVELDDVRPGGEQIAHLGVARVGIRHGQGRVPSA